MQRLTFVRYTIKPEQVAENEALSRAVFDELRATAPEHTTYALFRNGREFIHVFMNLAADDSAAVTELAAFKAYQKDFAGRCEAPAEVVRLGLEMMDSYGFSESLAVR
jgi:L-rhamnose mutarotase